MAPEECDLDAEGGRITAARMRKVLAQNKAQDVGPTERRLREWLVKDAKGFIAAADEKERVEKGDADLLARAEAAEARVRELESLATGGVDHGSNRVLTKLDAFLADPSNLNREVPSAVPR